MRRSPRLHGLPPRCSEHTVVMVLGSFPGARSLALQQYYAHPQNHFWPIMQAMWPNTLGGVDFNDYEARCAWLLARGVGLWDVYASCLREGSLDADIRDARLNDFAAVAARMPRLRALAHNGGESFRHSRKLLDQLAASRRADAEDAPLEIHRLPSSSPANASWRLERKLAAWREVFARHGLVA